MRSIHGLLWKFKLKAWNKRKAKFTPLGLRANELVDIKFMMDAKTDFEFSNTIICIVSRQGLWASPQPTQIIEPQVEMIVFGRELDGDDNLQFYLTSTPLILFIILPFWILD